jgi:pimeloyl-ACP methyl ester carboxylesterase
MKTGAANRSCHVRWAFLALAIAVFSLSVVAEGAFPGLPPGDSEFDFSDAPSNTSIRIYCHRPSGFGPSSPVVFAMSGDNRAAYAYRLEIKAESDRLGFLLIVPCFDEASFPGSNGYQLGNVLEETPTGLVVRPGETWTYRILDRLWDEVRSREPTERQGYVLYGHSAGAQFVHRLLLLVPEARVELAISANAGWYLVPDRGRDWPFGLGGSGGLVDGEAIRRWLERPLLLLLGDADVLDNFQFNTSPEAMLQGSTRFDRGKRFYAACEALASDSGAAFAWRRVVVPGVGHSNREMASAAASVIAAFYGL